MAKISAADRAYEAALKAIAKAIKAGDKGLKFDHRTFRALDRIPPEVRNVHGLIFLDLGNTAVSDLSPLQGMKKLKSLSLNLTEVRDLSPLRGLSELQMLSIDHTAVTDLSPLHEMVNLMGLYFDQSAVSDLLPLKGMTWLKTLSLDQTAVTDLSPLQGITDLEQLYFNESAVTDLTPLHQMTELQVLSFNRTRVTELTPLKAMFKLQRLALSQTLVSELTPLMGMISLQWLVLAQTGVSDLRLLTNLPLVSDGLLGGLWFADTPATAHDPELHRLSQIEDNQQRTRDTIAYLKTLPPWPEPLPWEKAPEPPSPDPAVPLRSGEDGISLATAPITDAELNDPIRATLHAALQDQVTDLVRVSANIEDATYRQACKLRDLLDAGLATMDPLLVHLTIEALRRIRTKTLPGTDRDYLLALEVVIDTGPGLTLDTRQVQLFIDRAQRNRLDRLAEVETDVQIRLAQSIVDSDLTAPDLKKVAALAADDTAQDQFTAIRPTLLRNYTIAVGQFVLAGVLAGPLGDIGSLALGWLVANAAEITSMSVMWGELFAAWIAPILDRAQHMADGVKHIASKLRNRK